MLDKFKEQQTLLDACAHMETLAESLAEQARSVRSQIMHLHVRYRAVSAAVHMLDSGMPRADISRALQARFGVKRRSSYNIINDALSHRAASRALPGACPGVAVLPGTCASAQGGSRSR